MAVRQDQIKNLLNNQISGRYRRSQFSLNAPTPGSSAALASAAGAGGGNAEASSTPEVSDNDGPSTPPTSQLSQNPPPPDTLKRKTRSSDVTMGSGGPSTSASATTTTAAAAAGSSSTAPGTPLASNPSSSTKRIKSSLSGSGKTPKKERLPPSARLADLGGISACIEQVLELIAMPICHPEIYLHTGVRPPRGVLLYGPPGCGKTMLANAIAGELGVAFINVSAPSIVSGMSGESEKTLRDTFEEAAKLAPCILFIDEIDAITPKRENAQREMERRIVAQLLTCMDDLSWDKTDNKPVMIIGATNRPDSLDPALRRAGRFDHEIAMGVPDEDAREQILRVQCSKLRLAGDFDYRALAKKTPGYVGADLGSLTGAAGIIAVKRIFQDLGKDSMQQIMDEQTASGSGSLGLSNGSATDTPIDGDATMSLDPPSLESISLNNHTSLEQAFTKAPFETLPPEMQILSIAAFLRAHPTPLTDEQLSPISITNADFELALTQVQPSSKREGFTTVPDVTWQNVGALSDIREELRMAIVQPVKHPEIFEAVGIANPCGVLLWGPPGCGKTLLAKAVANESRANFISVKGPELLNKYVGESERAVRQVFERARASSPCIVFFDELDALVPRRDDSLSESSARVVNTLLTELDGLTPRKQVFVIGATNRPDMVDPAMVRPGRFDKLLYVDLPTTEERYEILKTLTRKAPIDRDGVRLEEIAHDKRCEGFSGADIGALVREASVTALREALPAVGDEEMASQDEPSKTMKAGRPVKREVPTVSIEQRHFQAAFKKVLPSVSQAQRRKYEALRNRFAGIPVGKKRSVEAEADDDVSSSLPKANPDAGQGQDMPESSGAMA